MTTPKKTYTDRIVRGAYRAAQHTIQLVILANEHLRKTNPHSQLTSTALTTLLQELHHSIGELTTAEALHFAAQKQNQDQP